VVTPPLPLPLSAADRAHQRPEAGHAVGDEVLQLPPPVAAEIVPGALVR
jgi:hypothetical protein